MQRLCKLVGVAAFAIAAACPLHAQQLNFDFACATPPCPAGSLYTPSWGITIVPGNLQVVAQGTAGLSGTVNPKFLLVNSANYQAAFTLPKIATFASVDVARSNLSTASQTVTLQALLNGVPVASTPVFPLTAVNKWSTLSLSVPTGFNGLAVSSGTGGANRTFGVDNVRIAGNCAGFGDVPVGDATCDATEWLYNRSVTRGCVEGQYCPASPVTRAQMALFMQRLGTVLTPTVLSHLNMTTIDPNAGPGGSSTLCSVSWKPDRPTMAVGLASLVIARPSAPGTYYLEIVYSTDVGVTWALFPDTLVIANSVGAFEVVTQTSFTHSLPLDIERQYLFGARVYRQDAPPEAVTFHCHLQVRIENYNPENPPYDAATGVVAPIN